MKTYNKPYTQVSYCMTRDMLMSGNVSGGNIQGINDKPQGVPIVIN